MDTNLLKVKETKLLSKRCFFLVFINIPLSIFLSFFKTKNSQKIQINGHTDDLIRPNTNRPNTCAIESDIFEHCFNN